MNTQNLQKILKHESKQHEAKMAGEILLKLSKIVIMKKINF